MFADLSFIGKSIVLSVRSIKSPFLRPFSKVILCTNSNPPKAIGFIYKNTSGNHPLDAYVNSVDEVERITGIDFFPALPDNIEKRVEATYNLNLWEKR